MIAVKKTESLDLQRGARPRSLTFEPTCAIHPIKPVMMTVIRLCVTGSDRSAIRDSDRAELMWRPEGASNREGRLCACLRIDCLYVRMS